MKLSEWLSDCVIDLHPKWMQVHHHSQHRKKHGQIRELYRPDWKAWFPGDDQRSGTPDDPRFTLIAVEANTAVYLKIDKPKPVVLFEVVKGMVTGATPDLGEVQQLSGTELKRQRGVATK